MQGGRESVEMAPRVNTEEEWKRLSPPSEHLPSHFMEEDALSPQCSSIPEALEKYNHLRSPSPSPPPTSTFVAVLASKLPRGSVLLDASDSTLTSPLPIVCVCYVSFRRCDDFRACFLLHFHSCLDTTALVGILHFVYSFTFFSSGFCWFHGRCWKDVCFGCSLASFYFFSRG